MNVSALQAVNLDEEAESTSECACLGLPWGVGGDREMIERHRPIGGKGNEPVESHRIRGSMSIG